MPHRAGAGQRHLVQRTRNMGVLCIRRRYGEAFVVTRQVGCKVRIGRLHVVDSGQSHGFDQSVLQGLEQPLDASLGLRR